MKKVLSVLAVSAFVLTAGVALAGGPGKKDAGCPAACQQQIDDLNSSQAQQNEQLGAHGKQLVNHEGRVTTLIENGTLARDLNLPPLNSLEDRVMICGSPGMLRDLKVMIEGLGFKEGNTSNPGDFVIERAFAEQ